jgi:outer membrane protein W
MTANFFSGTIKASGDTSYQQFRVNESRYGVLVNAGVDYKINKTFGVTGGIKYNFSNLIGKSFQSATTTGNTDTGPTGVNVDTDVPLNDGMNGSIKAKSIYYIQIYAGVSYYFAYPLKYKKQ